MKKHLIRRSLAAVMTAALCVSLPPVMTSCAKTSPGDVTDDGTVSVEDIVMFQRFLLGTGTLKNAGNADLLNDGVVDVFDLALLKNSLLSEPAADTIYIHLQNDAITVEGDENGVVQISGTTAVITSSGVYCVDGSLTDGQIYVETAAEDTADVELVLSGVTMTNSTKPAIYTSAASGADKTKITLQGKNSITDTAAAAYTETVDGKEKTLGVIYSNHKLTFTRSSSGSLNIASSMNHAVSCEKKISLNGGSLSIHTAAPTTDAVTECDADAIHSDKAIEIEGGTLEIDASGDGIQSDENLLMTDGTVSIKAGKDAVQAATEIAVSGGKLTASGDRGFRLDAGGAVNITGGTVVATATDYQVDGNEAITFTGTQAVMLFDMAEEWKKDSAISVGTKTYPVNKKYDYVLISDSSLNSAETYPVYIGGAQAMHDGDAAGNFTNTGTVTSYQGVALLAGGGTLVTGNTVASLEFGTNGVTLYDASGDPVDAAAADNITVTDSTYVTVTKASILSVSGNCSNGQIRVLTDNTAEPNAVVELDLNGLTLSNPTAAPIFVENVGDEAVISAQNGTVNTISDGTSHIDTDTNSEGVTETVNGAIYAKDDLKLKGKGTLIVNGNTEDGIVCKNDLKLYNGTIEVHAVDDGIRGNDSVRIGNPDDTDYSKLNVTVKTNNGTSGGDGIKSSSTETGKGYVTINGGTVTIDAYADGIQAEQSVTLNGGTVNITTYETSTYGGGSSSSSGPSTPWGGGMGGMGGMQEGNANKTDISAKGIKAVGLYDTSGTTWQSGGDIAINGGTLTVDSSDDCIHAGGNIVLAGGLLELASADDAVHADHDVTIGQGTANTFDDVVVLISTAYEGIEGMNITQNSGSVVSNTTDDGYNAAGGSDGSGNMGGGPGGGWGQGGFGSGGNYSLTINGGFARVNVADGDHDGFDSNGTLTIAGGYLVSNGTDAFDAESTMTHSGGIFVEDTGNGGMGGMGGMGGGTLTTDTTASGSVAAGERITLCGSDGTVLISFLADKQVSNIKAGTGASGVKVYTGGTLNGTTYFQTADDTQLAGYGGTLSGGTAMAAGSSTGGNWFGRRGAAPVVPPNAAAPQRSAYSDGSVI